MADPLQLFQAGAERAAQFRRMALNLRAQSGLQKQRVGEQRTLMQEETALQRESPLFKVQVANLESSIRSRDADIKFNQNQLQFKREDAVRQHEDNVAAIKSRLDAANIISGKEIREDDQRILSTAKSNFDNAIKQLTNELRSSYTHANINSLLIDSIARKKWNGVSNTDLTPEEQQVLTFRDVADRIDGMIKVRDDATNSLSVVQQARQPQPTGLPRTPSYIPPPQPADVEEPATDPELDAAFGDLLSETGVTTPRRKLKASDFSPIPPELLRKITDFLKNPLGREKRKTLNLLKALEKIGLAHKRPKGLSYNEQIKWQLEHLNK